MKLIYSMKVVGEFDVFFKVVYIKVCVFEILEIYVLGVFNFMFGEVYNLVVRLLFFFYGSYS